MQATSFIQAAWRTASARRSLLASAVVLAWSGAETANLALVHTTGPEVYGVLTAAMAAGAAVGNIVLLRAPRVRIVLTGALLALWVVVALGGVAGTIAHAIGPVAGHGPIDLRPRPLVAPFVFTLLGIVGGASLFLGQRNRFRAAAKH